MALQIYLKILIEMEYLIASMIKMGMGYLTYMKIIMVMEFPTSSEIAMPMEFRMD